MWPIKEQMDLVAYGCGSLAYALVEADLVGELRVWIHPVVWGDGSRPFHDLERVRMETISTTTHESGIVRISGRLTVSSQH